MSARAATFNALAAEAGAANVLLGAVQAEFLREYLLGEAATAELHTSGTPWPVLDESHSTDIAARCQSAWNSFRDALPR